MRTKGAIALFLFAHQDDEYAIAPWLRREVEGGATVWCVYLTDGASRTEPAVRDSESRAVVNALGVPSENVAFLGNDDRIRDGALPTRLEYAHHLLHVWIAIHGTPASIYMPDWEGGHPDHDALHILGISLVLRHGVAQAWAFSIYNAYRCRKPFFSSLRLLPGGERRTYVHRLADGWRWAMLCWKYRSQRRTWLGLFPGAFFTRVVLRRESIRRCDPLRLAARPHKGPLLYERLFGMSYEQFSELTEPFVRRYLH